MRHCRQDRIVLQVQYFWILKDPGEVLWLSATMSRLIARTTLSLMLLLMSSCGEDTEFLLDVKVLTTIGQGVGDLAFVDEVVKGVTLARLQTDIYIDIFEPQTAEEAYSQFTEWLTTEQLLKDVLIVTVGAQYIELVENKNCKFSGRLVLHLDQNLPPCEGLRSASFRTYATSFLAGVAAMEVSERKTASAIGGMEITPVIEFIKGFEAGVAYAGGTFTEEEYLALDFSGFNNPKLAKETANLLYKEVDVIIPVAGGSAIGVIEAADQTHQDQDPENDRYVIGVDADQSFHAIYAVIGSVTKNLKRVTSDTIIDASQRKFTAEVINIGLAEGGSGFQVNSLFADQVNQAVTDAHDDAVAAEADYHSQP